MNALDWGVVAAYLAASTWLAARLAGKQQTIRDFFLGGRCLPWWAVAGSIVASEVSGVTFVAVAAATWAPGGSAVYLQFGLGWIVARAIIAVWFVPAFYRREIYSPYEFMGRELGPAVDRLATGLFLLGGFLGQGARLFVAALVLDAVAPIGIGNAIFLMGAVSIAWTWIGGINSVVWTDVAQFAILMVGAGLALVLVILKVPGGLGEVAAAGMEAGKFRVFNLSTDPSVSFTLWAALFGGTFLTLASHGMDQMNAQRIFCCRDVAAARKAVMASSVSVVLTAIMIGVGVALYAFHQHRPMGGEDAAKVAERVDYVFPLFILREMPVGVRGVLFAAIFAAASATSTLSAMAQTAVTTLYRPLLREEPGDKHLLFVSRLFIALAGLGLCGTAILCAGIRKYDNVLNLALSMTTYTYGPLLGSFLLALLPLRRDARGLVWGVPFSVLLVVALTWREEAWARWACAGGVGILMAAAVPLLRRDPWKILWVAAGASIVLLAAFSGILPKIAWPWMLPIGTLFTLGLGWAIGRKRLEGSPAPSL